MVHPVQGVAPRNSRITSNSNVKGEREADNAHAMTQRGEGHIPGPRSRKCSLVESCSLVANQGSTRPRCPMRAAERRSALLSTCGVTSYPSMLFKIFTHPGANYTTKPSSALSRSSLSTPPPVAPYTLTGTATSKLSHVRFSTATSTSPPRSSRDISSSNGCGFPTP